MLLCYAGGKKRSHGQILKWSKNQTYTSKGIEIRIKVYKFISCCKAGRILDSILLTLPYHDKDCHLQLDLAQAGQAERPREVEAASVVGVCSLSPHSKAILSFLPLQKKLYRALSLWVLIVITMPSTRAITNINPEMLGVSFFSSS